SIAFAAEYEGRPDVYVIPVQGGQPKRLTWHPDGNMPSGWSADGKAVHFVSTRETDHGRSGQLFSVAVSGGLPTKVMDARVYRGAFDNEQKQFAYIAFASGYNGLFGGSAGWKGYRGGTTPAIQIMDLDAKTVVTVPGADATNFNPLWLGDQLYFLSDRDNKQFSVFHYDPASAAISKVSGETVWDIRAAGGHGSTIVYEAGGRLKSLDVSSGETREIVIDIKPDLEQLRTSWRSAGKMIQAADISPTGKRVIATARGEVFTIPTDEGSTRNISSTGTVREYSAMWSPAGDRVAWITDSLQGQKLVIANQDGTGSRKTFELGPHFYDLLAFAGSNNDRIVFEDNHLNLHVIELARGQITKIAEGARRDQVDVAVSPDGAWLAYTKELPNYLRDLMLYNFASQRHYRVSDGMADVAAPAFSRDGKTLFFAASTNSGPLQVGLNMTSQERPYRAGLYAAVLAADGKSPLLPGSGDETGKADDENNDESKDDDRKDKKEEKKTATRIDTDGLSERVVALQVAERHYDNLAVADDGKLYFVQRVQAGGSNEPPGSDEQAANELMRFDFEEREVQSLLKGIDGFRVSADGKQLLLNKVDGSLAVAEVGDELKPESLSLDGLQVRVNPREEWSLIFDEVWRMEKEFFYDPNMHGLDWQAIYERYRPLVAHVGRREDLNELLVQMIGEMQVGHNRVGGGDVYRGGSAKTGLLGANLEIHNGHYRIARVYSGESWNPFVRAPLATP
ncbi:MAG: PDZ domain-containing protein, partial [Woeseia sp.]